jgi:hypothetical protein
MIKTNRKNKLFEITSVARQDLEDAGFDTSKIDDGTMDELASKMANTYLEQIFWIDLPIIAEHLNIPRRPIKVEDIEHLKELIRQGHHDFAISLKHGLISRKQIKYDEKKQVFKVKNLIDNSKERLTEKKLLDDSITNIGKAITKGAFFAG